MSENWKFYLCRVNEKAASIFVDLGLREELPNLSKKRLLWVWAYFKNPRADGLSDGNEAPTLLKIVGRAKRQHRESLRRDSLWEDHYRGAA